MEISIGKARQKKIKNKMQTIKGYRRTKISKKGNSQALTKKVIYNKLSNRVLKAETLNFKTSKKKLHKVNLVISTLSKT